MRWKSDLEIKFPFYFLVDILLFNVVSVRRRAVKRIETPSKFCVSSGLVVQQHSKAHIPERESEKKGEEQRRKKRDRWIKA